MSRAAGRGVKPELPASATVFEVEVGASRRRERASAEGPRVCPAFHAAVELVGRRWAGAILWALAERPLYFAEIGQAVPGLSDRLLSRRLRELEEEGLVEREVHEGTPPRVSYGLTGKGRELEPALRELAGWGRRWKLG